MYTETKRVEYLDSIRGLAALFVLLGHVVAVFKWPAAYWLCFGWPFIAILIDGKAAVVMFFVLSGYVLSKPYVVTSKAPPPQNFSTYLLSPAFHPYLDSVVFCFPVQPDCLQIFLLAANHRTTNDKMVAGKNLAK
jgi:hypothetical protein